MATLSDCTSNVGKPKGQGRLSIGLLAVAVLNAVLHPVLCK